MFKIMSRKSQGNFNSLISAKGFSVKALKNSADYSVSADTFEIILVDKSEIVNIVNFLKMNEQTQFNLLFFISATDYPDHFELTYHLYSVQFNSNIILKSYLDKNNPEIESLSSVFTAADWHERETYDLLGIKFKNHPDLKRILLPDDWIGHPLRKDYVNDDERLIWNQR